MTDERRAFRVEGTRIEQRRREGHEGRRRKTRGSVPTNGGHLGEVALPNIGARAGRPTIRRRRGRADGSVTGKFGHEGGCHKKAKMQNEPKFDQAGVEKFGKQSQKRTQVEG